MSSAAASSSTPHALADNLIHRFNVGDTLRRSAARYPNKLAIHFQGRELTYAQLDALTNQVARFLLQAGIRRGDPVAILGLNSPEYVAAFFGCARIGAPLVPINLMLTPNDIDYVLEKVRAKAIFIAPMLASKLNHAGAVVMGLEHRWLMDAPFLEALHQADGTAVEEYVENDDPATIIFTSGTTARPKAVVNTHLNWYANLISAFADSTFNRHWRILLALPMFHVAGLSNVWSCFSAGMESVIITIPKPDLILDAIRKNRPDVLGLPATVYVGLLNTPGVETVDFSCLKRMAVFQYLPTNLFNRWREMVPQAEWMNYWGQTEMTPLGSSTPPEDLERKLCAPDPIGLTHLPLELRVVDDDMNELPPGKVGEFVCRGPAVTPGYLYDPAATEALFRGGWHHTGDMGYKDDEGYLYFVDRKKDMIKSGGENVASQEVEEAMALHPAVAEVAVVGVADDYWIEKVVAVVVASTETTPDELLRFGRAHLASFKAPKQVYVVDHLPKNPTGKVLKRELRKQIEQGELQ
jgi:fatty-acyl-CoA synthase